MSITYRPMACIVEDLAMIRHYSRCAQMGKPVGEAETLAAIEADREDIRQQIANAINLPRAMGDEVDPFDAAMGIFMKIVDQEHAILFPEPEQS